MAKGRARYQRTWLRQHRRIEQGLRGGLSKVYRSMARTVSGELTETLDITSAFDIAHWEEKLIGTARIWLRRGMVAGAGLELATNGPDAKSVSISVDGVKIAIPDAVMQAIDTALKDQLSADYWSDTLASTRESLRVAVSGALEDGTGFKDIVRLVQTKLNEESKWRAARIARTETTGALNAGHHHARAGLIDDGLITGSEWLSSEDSQVRPDHAAANGQVVAKGETFKVGGESARYPGDPALSAKQRVACRCLTIAAGSFADD